MMFPQDFKLLIVQITNWLNSWAGFFCFCRR